MSAIDPLHRILARLDPADRLAAAVRAVVAAVARWRPERVK